MQQIRLFLLMALVTTTLLASCHARGTAAAAADTADSTAQAATVPAFDADSAYAYVKRQVDFGPRVPGTAAHRACADWMEASLRRAGADTVIVQQATVTAANGDRLPIRNIMGRFGTDKSDRMLLLAHWDTRPWADEDPDEANHTKPLPGANDGGSGVGVLLELARMLGANEAPVGVDILMVDAEDYGVTGAGDETSWCLGSQYWTTDMPYTAATKPRYAILLDMVGGINARFHREPFSDRYARDVVDKVWASARKAGYGDRFIDRSGMPVVDDHIFVLGAGIPAIDIIEGVNEATGSFPPTWHTMADDMSSISASSLKAVGQTLAQLLYNETPTK